MATELTTITRKDYSNAIKCFDKDTRDAIDRAIALGNEFAQAHNEEAKRLNIARAVAIYHIAQDQEAVEKAGYTKFKDLASALFAMKPELATNYRKAAEQFYCNENAPTCKDWWGPTTLYLFCAKKIDNDTIKAAIEAGKLKQDTTNDGIKAWIASLEADALEDGKPEVLKLFDGELVYFKFEPNKAVEEYRDIFHAWTIEEIKAAIDPSDGTHDDTYFTSFDPHADLTRPTKKGTKTIKGKGIAFNSIDVMARAVYFPAETTKAKGPTEKTVQAQNDTIAKMRAAMIAAGLDPDAI